MSGKRYPEEFKIEAVKQVVDRGHSISSVATRLDITTHSLYAWIKKYGPDSSTNKEQSDAQAEIRRLQKELKRVTDERDILKKAAVDSIGQRNNHVKTCGCGGSFDETYIYSKRKIARFRLVEEWD
ncbi:transposase, partial [Enterobacter bugandensis]|uniref:transposase n=5 Tax=Enterobacter TaxID=547 RepID=UPI00334ED6F1